MSKTVECPVFVPPVPGNTYYNPTEADARERWIAAVAHLEPEFVASARRGLDATQELDIIE